MNFFFLYSFLTFAICNANKYISNQFYSDNKCKEIIWVSFSYENTEACSNMEELNTCSDMSMIAEESKFSSKMTCGSDAYKTTQELFKNKDFIYMNLFDPVCSKELGAFAVLLNKCVSLLTSNTYFKISQSGSAFTSKIFSDSSCKTEVVNNNAANDVVDLQTCADKITIYTKDGKYDMNVINNNSTSNSTSNSTNNSTGSSSNNTTSNAYILSYSLLLYIIVFMVAII